MWSNNGIPCLLRIACQSYLEGGEKESLTLVAMKYSIDSTGGGKSLNHLRGLLETEEWEGEEMAGRPSLSWAFFVT